MHGVGVRAPSMEGSRLANGDLRTLPRTEAPRPRSRHGRKWRKLGGRLECYCAFVQLSLRRSATKKKRRPRWFGALRVFIEPIISRIHARISVRAQCAKIFRQISSRYLAMTWNGFLKKMRIGALTKFENHSIVYSRECVFFCAPGCRVRVVAQVMTGERFYGRRWGWSDRLMVLASEEVGGERSAERAPLSCFGG